MNYIEAVKKWNQKKGGKYVNPKKGSAQHKAVMKIMKGGGLFNKKKKMKIMKGGGLLDKLDYNPKDFHTWSDAEHELIRRNAPTKVIMQFYKSLVPQDFPANPKEWRDNWDMKGNFYQFLKAQNITQADYDEVGIDSNLKDIPEDEPTGGSLRMKPSKVVINGLIRGGELHVVAGKPVLNQVRGGSLNGYRMAGHDTRLYNNNLF